MADEGPSPARQMSLIPFQPGSREVVLQRGNAVVLYDSQSRQLLVRQDGEQDADEPGVCPMCRRPFHETNTAAGTHDFNDHYGADRPFVDPEYFAMLAESQRPSPAGSGRSTPSRRVHLALRSGRSRDVSGTAAEAPSGAEFVSSEPSAARSEGISSSAFSPGYFNQFFKEIRELGRGGNGVVMLVEHVIDNVSLGQFACKRIPVGDSRAYFEKVIIEVRLLQKIPHRNLVAYHWTWLEDHQPSKFGPRIPCLWILQDFCNGGDLQSYVLGPQAEVSVAERLKARMRRRSRGEASPTRNLYGPSRLTLDEIATFFKDITSGLHHLHSKGYIHRDLKPSNCLLQQDGGRTRVLISDFGEVQLAGDMRRSTGATGTVAYLAPEVLQQAPDGSYRNFTTKSDIFSLGMIVYFMCFGRLPYATADGISEEDEDLDELRAEITGWAGLGEGVRPRPDLPDRLYQYLKRLLSANPAARPSTEEILSSIKKDIPLGDAAVSFEDFSNPRVSNVDTPARPTRRPTALVPRTGLASPQRHNSSDDVRPRSPVKHEKVRHRSISAKDSSTSFEVRRREIITARTDSRSPAQQSPRLMLPPPPPRSMFGHMTDLVHQPGVTISCKVLFFFVKLATFTIPCAPYAAHRWLFYPLLGLAALDLSLLSPGVRRSALLLGLHLIIAIAAARNDLLCEARELPTWISET